MTLIHKLSLSRVERLRVRVERLRIVAERNRRALVRANLREARVPEDRPGQGPAPADLCEVSF